MSTPDASFAPQKCFRMSDPPDAPGDYGVLQKERDDAVRLLRTARSEVQGAGCVWCHSGECWPGADVPGNLGHKCADRRRAEELCSE